MQSKSSGIGWVLVLGMAVMGLSAMPDDPPAAQGKTPAVHQAEQPKKTQPSSQPPDVTCDGNDCWWTDQGRPGK